MSETSSPQATSLSAHARAAHRRATIIVGSMMSSLFVYAIVVELVGRGDMVVTTSSVPEVVRWVLYAVAVSMVFAANVVMALMLRGFTPRDEDAFVTRMTTAQVATAALAEVPAILGLVLFILTRERVDFYFLAIISLYLLLRHFPRVSLWERLAARYGTGG